jgi:holliday junction DNA helicase RuvA
MIGMLRGAIIEIKSGSVLLDVNGVGYLLHIPTGRDGEIVLGKEVTFYTHLAVREDALTLYGFHSSQEKQVFELLVGVSGIGPRLGLAVLSTYAPIEIQSAIASGRAEAFSAVSGIGKKNAERIILELKNKMAIDSLDQLPLSPGGELTAALSALGYSAAEAIRVSQQVDASLPLSDQIKTALSKLTNGQ